MDVRTICPKCGCGIDWEMKPGTEAPDCPNCGFDATGRDERRRLRATWRCFEGHTDKVLSAEFSPDGRMIASAGWDKVIRLWDVAKVQQVAALRGHTENITAVAFLPDGTTVASSSGDSTIRLWDLQSRNQRAVLSGHSKWVMGLAVSPEGKTLISGSSDPSVKIWDLETCKERATVAAPGRVNAIACSPAGDVAASASEDGTVMVIDLQTGLQRIAFQGGSRYLAFSPDGQTLASGCPIGLWNVAAAKNVAVFKESTDCGCESAAFSPDGKWLVSVQGRTVHVWDVQRLRLGKRLEGRSVGLASVSFCPVDPKLFVTAGLSGLVNVRSLDEDGQSPAPTSPIPTASNMPQELAAAQNPKAETSRPEKKWWEFWK